MYNRCRPGWQNGNPALILGAGQAGRTAIETARELGLQPSTMRAILCKLLKTPPDPDNSTEFPYV
jgi:phage terminase small subunit